MSDFQGALQKWRNRGSLRYLAHFLGVSTKQVTRYWDDGCVPGGYRTMKGHRRIAYKDDTAETVASRVRRSKRRNIAIRYHKEEIEYCGTLIRVKGCTNVRALYQRARDAGLDVGDAWNAATSIDTSDSDRDPTWELLWAAKGTCEEEVGESVRFFSQLRVSYLCEACDPKDFRSKARAAWRSIVSAHKRRFGCDAFSSSLGEKAQWRKPLKPLRNLLLERDLESFLRAYRKATELHRRAWEFVTEGLDDERFLVWNESVKTQPKVKQLEVAAYALKRTGEHASASALARQLRISRPALYRAFTLKDINATLKPLRNDARAIAETRNNKQAKGKKSNRVSGHEYG